MAPAEGELHLAPAAQRLVALIAIDLQDAPEPGEVRQWALAGPIRGIDIGDPRRIRSAPGPTPPLLSSLLPRVLVFSNTIPRQAL